MRLLKLIAMLAPLVSVGVAWAGTISGTTRADILRGTPRSDTIYGKAGNDRLFGYGGRDVLVGGPGADLLACGPARDVAIADRKDKVRRDCEVVKGRARPAPPPPPPASNDRVYVALGDSTSTPIGASSPSKSWVQLYYGHLAASAGVTRLRNLAQPGHTTTDLRRFRLPSAVGTINGSDDTVRVTITIGINDVCAAANDPACPIAGNLRAILTELADALARDPGEETIQLLEHFNFEVGTPRESQMRAYLLGSDLKVDCSASGSALGLNDLIHCIALERNAQPIDVVPVFDAAGETFLAADHTHANDFDHRAIALALGGAVEAS